MDPLDIPLDAIVTHELGHAVCATELGLKVCKVEMPLPYPGDDGRLYGRKGTTQIEDIWTDDSQEVLNPENLDETACISVAGVVAERLSRNQPTNALEVIRQLQTGRNNGDYRLLSRAIRLDEILTQTAVTPYIECAASILAPQIEAIQRAVPLILAKISAADDALDFTWSEIASILGR